MKKTGFFFSLLCTLMVSYSYAQPYDQQSYDGGPQQQQFDGNQQFDGGQQFGGGDGGNCDQPACPPERPMNDCYCLYCRYEPCYYNKWHCNYCPKYCYKKCCRQVPQYYQKQCCRYVPQYYCQTCCRYVPQYYYTCTCHYVPKYTCERCCRYVPKYYYKHTCQPTCTPDCCAEAPR